MQHYSALNGRVYYIILCVMLKSLTTEQEDVKVITCFVYHADTNIIPFEKIYGCHFNQHNYPNIFLSFAIINLPGVSTKL